MKNSNLTDAMKKLLVSYFNNTDAYEKWKKF